MPRWSPDGRQIAFYSNRSGKYQVWSVRPDGSGIRQLTDGPENTFGSNWSPAGTQMLSFSDVPDDLLVRGFLWNPAKPWHEQTPQFLPSQISDEGTELWLTDYDGDWSPDGRKIAGWFKDGRDGDTYQLAIYDLASQQYRIATNSESWSRGLAYCPRWMNDSQRLLVLDDRGALLLVDSETNEQKEILSLDAGRIGAFCISKSNDLIFFASYRDETDIWMLTLDER
jgi:Tol biopolymer transport system component